jgi:peptidoglycan-associated lipoprotein
MNRTSRLPLVATTLAGALLLGACASPSLKSPTAAAPAAAPTAAATAPAAAPAPAAAQAQPAAQSNVAAVDLTRQAQPAAAVAALNPYIYFDFDSSLIRDEFMPTVDQHARVLSTDRNQRLRIAGHTDERGGREYNLALGQQRAEAVSRALVLLGTDATRIEAVSYGEERPKATGSDESAWQQNRRAELRAQR